MRTLRSWLWVLLLPLTGCGYNTLQSTDEAIKAQWAEVLNQYQRRADLIPNLVKTVEAFAKQEREVIVGVTEARAKVGSIQATPELVDDPAKFQQFQAAQGELSSALSRLLVVVERYPDLKSDAKFRDLQAQLEGTENRIAVARRDYIESVKTYNTEIRTFPGLIWHKILYSDLPVRETFEAAPESQKAPSVKF